MNIIFEFYHRYNVRRAKNELLLMLVELFVHFLISDGFAFLTAVSI